MADLQIRTVWRTAAEHCEIVWSAFKGYHVRLWVHHRMILDELMTDVDAAFGRAWELRTEWRPLSIDSAAQVYVRRSRDHELLLRGLRLPPENVIGVEFKHVVHHAALVSRDQGARYARLA